MWRRRVLVPFVPHHLHEAPGERPLTSQGLEKHDSEAVPVGGLAERPARSLLGRHVRRSADYRDASLRAREGEVGDHAEVEENDPSFARDEDVRRLDVAMELAGGVESLDPADRLSECLTKPVEMERRGRDRSGTDRPLQAQRHESASLGAACRRPRARGRKRRRHGPGGDTGLAAIRKRRPAHVFEKADPVDQLHGEEPLVLAGEEFVQTDEVRVREIREGAKLPLQPEERLDVPVAEGLERDDRVSLAVECLVHDAEAAGAEAALDLKTLRAAELLFLCQGHGSRCSFWSQPELAFGPAVQAAFYPARPSVRRNGRGRDILVITNMSSPDPRRAACLRRVSRVPSRTSPPGRPPSPYPCARTPGSTARSGTAASTTPAARRSTRCSRRSRPCPS